jgi:hypothetical protein
MSKHKLRLHKNKMSRTRQNVRCGCLGDAGSGKMTQNMNISNEIDMNRKQNMLLPISIS